MDSDNPDGERDYPEQHTKTHGRTLRQKISRMGRRNYLSFLASLGVSGVGLKYTTKDAAAKETGNHRKQVPYTARIVFKNPGKAIGSLPDHQLETKAVVDSIPRDQWVRMKGAIDAGKRLTKSLKRSFNTPYVDAGLGSENGEPVVTVLHLRPKAIPKSALGYSVGRLKGAVPSTVTGAVGSGTNKTTVELQTKFIDASGEFSTASCQYLNKHYDNKYSSVPAGTAIGAAYSSSCVPATVTTPVYNSNTGNRQLLTAGHANLTGSGAKKGHTYWDQPDQSSTKVGHWYSGENNVVTYSGEIDGDGSDDNALITDLDAGTITNKRGSTYQLADYDGGYHWYIEGYNSNTHIQSSVTNGKHYYRYKQGINTGLKNDTPMIYFSSNYDWLAVKANNGDGDSGGPMFQRSKTKQTVYPSTSTTGVSTYPLWLNALTSSTISWDGKTGAGGNTLEAIFNADNSKINLNLG